MRLHTIYSFVVAVLPLVAHCKNILEDLVDYLTPLLTPCSSFTCALGEKTGSKHNEQLVIDLLCKYISPMLKNYAKSVSDKLVRTTVAERKKKRAAKANKAAVENQKSKAESRKLKTVQPF